MSLSRWVLRGLTLVAVLALMLALVAACKSSKKSDDGGGKTPAAEQSPSSNETPDGDGGGDGQSAADLEELASAAAEGATGKITYKYTTPAGDQEWTLVQRPPDSRFEMVTSVGGQESRVIVIQTEDKSYVCTSAGGSENCLVTEDTESYTAAFSPIFDVPQSIVEGIDDSAIVDQSERKIGGVNATCFTTDTTAFGGGASEVCFSDEGILLLLQGDAPGASYKFEAKSVSTDVSDADFEPPYEVIELPSG